MKKQNQTCLPAGRKFSLNKKTISNLNAAEMNKHIGGAEGARTNTCYFCTFTCKGKTCNHPCTF
jgi:hypothetical protein